MPAGYGRAVVNSTAGDWPSSRGECCTWPPRHGWLGATTDPSCELLLKGWPMPCNAALFLGENWDLGEFAPSAFGTRIVVDDTRGEIGR